MAAGDDLHAQSRLFLPEDAERQVAGLGDGQGGFRPLPAVESGLRITGEQRACAAAVLGGNGTGAGHASGFQRAHASQAERRGMRYPMHARS